MYLAGCFLLLFLSSLPDAMVVPVLKELTITRYDVGAGAAHAFMCVNIVGAMGMARYLKPLEQRFPAMGLIAACALLNGLLLFTLSFDIGFTATLIVRTFEGAVDIAVYALLFHQIARLGDPAHKGRRMGAAATCMMMGIAIGIGVGGVVASHNPLLSLQLGALACGIVTVASLPILFGARRLHLVDPTPDDQNTSSNAENLGNDHEHAHHPAWPACLFMFADRALASLLATTFAIYFSTVFELTSRQTGLLIGIAMLMTALGAWPAGRLAERIGWKPLRVLGGVVYATGIAVVPFVAHDGGTVAFVLMVFIGLAGASLFASSILLVSNHKGGATTMGAYHASGNIGFLLGTITAGSGLALLARPESGGVPGNTPYVLLFIFFGCLHLILNFVAIAAASQHRHSASEMRSTQVVDNSAHNQGEHLKMQQRTPGTVVVTATTEAVPSSPVSPGRQAASSYEA